VIEAFLVKQLLLLSLVSLAVSAQELPSIVLHPLEVKKAPLDFNKKTAEELQSDLRRLARKNGCRLTDTPKDGHNDCSTNNESLRELAVEANSLYVLYSSVDLGLDNIVTAVARVVRDDGVVMRGPKTVKLPLGKDKFSDVARAAMGQAIDALEMSTLPAVKTVIAVKVDDPVKPKDPEIKVKDPTIKPPDVVVNPPIKVVKPVEPVADGQWMKPTGLVVGGIGLATAIAGGVIFAMNTFDPARIPPNQGFIYQSTKQQMQPVGVGLLAGGGAVALAGGIIYLMAPSDAPKVVVIPSANGGSVNVMGKF
jgi:hypothetical protein